MLMVVETNDNLKIRNLDFEKKLFGTELLNNKRSEIPAITHIDYSARIQTVSNKTNKKFYDLFTIFYNLTGCPLLVNTFFKFRGEPIAGSTIEAFKCFMGTDLDVMVIENVLLLKNEQNQSLKEDYMNKCQ